MSRDFLSKQVRSGKVIGNNNSGSEPKLIIYSDSNAIDSNGANSNTGDLSIGLDTRLGSVGADTFVYIDGIPGSKKLGTANTVAVFGGDVVISGSLYAEGNTSSMWEVDPANSDNLIPTNTIDGDTGLFAMNFDLEFSENGFIETSSYTLTNRDCALDKYFEYDSSDSTRGTITPK